MLAHTGDAAVNKKLGKQKAPVSNHPEVNSCHYEKKSTVLSENNWYFALNDHSILKGTINNKA